jgi:putative ABC transport system permease protein
MESGQESKIAKRDRHTEGKKHQPPQWAQRFIEWYCKPRLAEDLMGDLHEYFDRNVQSSGPRYAKLIYVIDAFKFFRPYTVRAPEFLNFLINWIMIRSYVKTSLRTLSRNKLFSVINITGLAISMSVGLLLIAFVHDLLSYDRFNDKGSRIFRITSHATFKDGNSERFATTSLKVGKLIKENVKGLEEAAIIRSEFTGDAAFGEHVVPLTGFYAEPSFLRIFTLPLLKGDPSSALQNPYSIVLTEASAKKLFGADNALGKSIHINNRDYQVTGILQDIPFFSHIKFESLVSFSTLETELAKDLSFQKWSQVWERNYVYLLLPRNSNVGQLEEQLVELCERENRKDDQATIRLSALPLYDIVLGEELSNSVGPVMPGIVLWIIGGLATVVILSACFNYTNLSIARSLRRLKEIGLRKVIGAAGSQVRMQFLVEAVVVSLFALILSFGLFLLLRPHFVSIAPELLQMVALELTPMMILTFIAFAMMVGVLAGILPSLFFAKVHIMQALRDATSVKVVRGGSFRRALIVVQYALTLMFITSTVIGYVQYKKILAFDLGFNTENILNVSLQKNRPDILIEKLKALPEVSGVSQSRLLTSVGNAWGGFVKYRTLSDSALVLLNIIDENYLPLHGYTLVAGQNFITRPATKDATNEIIVNEKTIRKFNIAGGDPVKAIDEELLLNNKRLTIVGVIKDFHYSKLDSKIEPVVFTYLTPDAFLTRDGRDGLINIRVKTDNPTATLAKIEKVWQRVDPVHPFKAEFYDDSIEDAYKELSAMIKIIGFLSLIAISIASLGLLGMVVYTTEIRLKEMSIRRVLGATSGNLVFLIARGFVTMLSIAAVIALPVTYLFFDRLVLTHFPYHEPVGLELFVGLVAVFAIACAMILSQSVQVAKRNPAEVLKGE